MREPILEGSIHLLVIIGYAVVALLTGVAGLILEYQSYLHVIGGEYPLGMWIAAIGAVLLLFSYLCITDKLLPHLFELRASR